MKQLHVTLLLLACGHLLMAQPTIEAAKLPNDRFQFVDKQSRQPVHPFEWDEVEPFVNGYARVASGNQWNLVGMTGNPIHPSGFDGIRNMVNERAAVQRSGKWGVIDAQGRQVISFLYDILFDFREPVTGAYKNNHWFLVGRDGTVMKALDVDVFRGFNKGLASITRQGRNGKMNVSGQIVSWDAKPQPSRMAVNQTISSKSALSTADCPDNISFEAGNFTNWETFTGKVQAVGTTNVITVTQSAPTPNRHVIYAASNPSALDPYGLFPTNPPDGSTYALKLGNNKNGAQAERVSYNINVPANAKDASITYRYAVVFQDPGHLTYQQPRFQAKLLDVATNTYLPCASFEYVSDDGLPGFFNSTVDDSVKCRAWSSVFINLSPYAGKSLVLEFTTADCTKGAHWGYAYVDVGDCNVTASIDYSCNPSRAILQGPPGFQNYNWWDSAFTHMMDSGQTVTLTPAPPLHSIIHVEVKPQPGFGCTDTLEVEVLNLNPNADAGPDKAYCIGSSVQIGTTGVAGNSYSWSPATALSDPNIADPVSNPSVTTTYIVTVNNPNNACTAYDTVQVAVSAAPMAQFDAGPPQCLNGNNFTFQNNSTSATKYDWAFGDSTNANIMNPTHGFTLARTYTTKLVVTAAGGCKDSISHPVVVLGNPMVSTLQDTAICRGKSISLPVTGSNTYAWTPATGLSCTDCSAPSANPVADATYIATGTDGNGCTGSDTVHVHVYQPIQVSVSPDQAICELAALHLQAAGAASYSWSPVAGLNDPTRPDPTATPSATTTYHVIGFDGHQCFTDTGSVTVIVNPNPTLDLGPDLRLPTGDIHTFTPQTGNGPIVSWEWTPSTDLSCSNCPSPSATIKTNIRYWVEIRNIHGCTTTDTVAIQTFCEGTQVFIPNAFTPDGDMKNDVFMIRAKGIASVKSLRIFSRWGELVFERKNFPPNSTEYSWDGKIRGTPGPAEVYVYTVEVVCDNQQTYMYKGNVTLLK
jgi:gliding motility-associated-like protein